MEDILYADLVTKIGINDLTPGEQYRITDYVTTYYIYEYANAYPWTLTNTTSTDSGGVEAIIVAALTDTILSLEAKSETHPGDTLYYTIDNIDAGVFASTKGTITRRIDGMNQIDMPYDYRAIEVTYNSTNYSSIPSTSRNVRIGLTAPSSDPASYAKTIPILILDSATDLKIDIVDDTNGLIVFSLNNIVIGTCIQFSSYANSASFCNLQIINLSYPGSGVTVRNFIGGHLTNIASNSQLGNVHPANNPNLYSAYPKIAIPGGYFTEFNILNTQTQSTYVGEYAP